MVSSSYLEGPNVLLQQQQQQHVSPMQLVQHHSNVFRDEEEVNSYHNNNNRNNKKNRRMEGFGGGGGGDHDGDNDHDHDDDDEEESSFSNIGDEDENNNNNKMNGNGNGGMNVHDTFVAKEATRTANCAGYCVLLSLIAVGAILAVIAYFFITGTEQDDFEREYDVVKVEVIDGATRNAQNMYEQLLSLGRLFPHQVDNKNDNDNNDNNIILFPQVQEYELFALQTRSSIRASCITYAPWLRTEDERNEWNQYFSSQQGNDGGISKWLQQAYAVHPELSNLEPPLDMIRFNNIWRYYNYDDDNNNIMTNETETEEGDPNNNNNNNNLMSLSSLSSSFIIIDDPGPAPYAPIHQVSPPPPPQQNNTNNDNIIIINQNLASWDIYLQAANITSQNYNIGLLTEPIYNISLLYGSSLQPIIQGDENIPHALAIVPVSSSLLYDNDNNENNNDDINATSLRETVMGHISAAIPWTALFDNILQSHQNGITIVVNSCNGRSVHTYQINGDKAIYKGLGDLHDTAYNSYAHETFFYGLVNRSTLEGVDIFCKHEFIIYPTSTYEDYFTSNDSRAHAATIAGVAFLAIVLFLSYDCIVRKQQSRVLGEAERSNAIVASLFPGKVARKLFMDTSRHSSGMDISTHSTHSNNLLNFMSKGDHKTVEAARPIAELFPEATVMFADIAGFTAWSSIREPQHVFMLLESIFQAFDGIAKSFGVFKVETVGDCYVACCGVPEPNEDHATVMAQFARECLRKFHLVVQDLELKLGPDTSDLAMRFGLNSGPVTAGVLRGERARFQLFGDTVNTAARMESTGARNRIHISEHTAELLVAHGRGPWIKAREDPVQAKGKGTLKTFWLEEDVSPPRLWQDNQTPGGTGVEMHEDDAIDLGSNQTPKSGDELLASNPSAANRASAAAKLGKVRDLDANLSSLERKTQRLVDWNTELLMQLLKQVVARRFAVSGRRAQPDALWEMAQNVGEGHMPVEEVVEIIQLPDFDDRAIRQVDPDTVILSPEVAAQCRTYVGMLASMYRDNPFHNFEHASHVTMSVSKLLSRIVAPEIDRDLLEHGALQELLLHDHTYGITSDPLTQFSVVLSALIHDVDHRGVPNFLLVKEDENLANTYENKSVAEQNSVDLAWKTLMRPEFGELRSCIFSDLTELRRFRALLINSVIATDIFDKEQGTMRKNRWAKAFSETHKENERRDQNRKATIVIEHLIQASDVAHTMQHWHVYQKWNERLFQEMYQAFLTGRWEKDPSQNWYENEIGFFDNYIIPLAKKLKDCGVFGVASDEYLNYALENRREWATKGRDVVARLVQKYGPSNGDEEEAKLPS